MVKAELRIETIQKVKGNHFYGNFEIKTVETRTIINERYTGLIAPKNGLMVTFKNVDEDKVIFTIDSHYYTGEYEKNVCDDTTFSTSFTFAGHVYEVEVNLNGELVSLTEWYDLGDFEDGNEPYKCYSANSKSIKWELMER